MKNASYKKLAEEWLERADEDLGVAKILFDEKSYPAAICYHCHQTAEKSLKGFLVCHGKDIGKDFRIHNLIQLFKYCAAINKRLPKKMGKSCRFLNKYYIVTRYPGDSEEYPWDEVKEALTNAIFVKDKITKICKN